MPDYHLYVICGQCEGTGTVPSGHGPYPCANCKGTGRLLVGMLSDDLVDWMGDVKDKLDDIFEKVNE